MYTLHKLRESVDYLLDQRHPDLGLTERDTFQPMQVLHADMRQVPYLGCYGHGNETSKGKPFVQMRKTQETISDNRAILKQH